MAKIWNLIAFKISWMKIRKRNLIIYFWKQICKLPEFRHLGCFQKLHNEKIVKFRI